MSRFKNPILRRTYDAMRKAYADRHHDLIRADGSRNLGNGFAGAFWRGFDGVLAGRWDSASRQTPSYACWCAGRDIAKGAP